MNRDPSQQRTLDAATADAESAVAEFDRAREWLSRAGGRLAAPLGAEVWAFDEDLARVLLVKHRRRGWVPPGGEVENGETPREAAVRELAEETGVHAVPLRTPAAVTVRSYGSELPPTLGLSYAVILDPAAVLRPEPGQPAAWLRLDRPWDSCFADDRPRMRRHASWLAGSGRGQVG